MNERVAELERRLAEAEEKIRILSRGKTDPTADDVRRATPPLSMAQRALRESEDHYRQIVEFTTEGIVKVDPESVIVFSNLRFAAMLGYGTDELLGRNLLSFMDPESERIAREARERRKRGVRDSVDLTFRHKEGRDVSVSMAGAPIFDGENRYVGSLGLARDVTEQKKLMAQLMVSDRMASVGTLAAGVAHEINNPLAVVVSSLGYMSECLEGPGGGVEALREPLAEAIEAAQRVRRIVHDLKRFSRAPDEEFRAAVDVRAVIESTIRMAWNEIRHRAQLVQDCREVPMVLVNEARLGQVLLNLVVNAAQALPEGRSDQNEIRITTRHEGDRVIVEVSDTGAGIAPENIGRIFDAFFTTKPVGVGTGLGLAISHRIVTSLGGELTVRSTVGEGTTFRVSLPSGPDE